MYNEKFVVRIAKRENNTKRSYLVVNRLQAKHIPSVPSETFGMFDALAEKIKGTFPEKSALIIGFAETATAIGARLASYLGTYYMHTTREDFPDEYLNFTESHSHAVQQKIIRTGIETIADKITDIVFAEDELTTGNTIIKAVAAFQNAYPKRNIRFHAVSLLNGMDENCLQNYAEKNISVDYLIKTKHDDYPEIAEKYADDGNYYTLSKPSAKENVVVFEGYEQPRILTDGKKYQAVCDRVAGFIWAFLEKTKGSVLVLGTEECMYPAINAASYIESFGREVYTHSTTRSPIAVSSDKDYPLHSRYELKSLYESERVTFLYDIGKYDNVVIVTDAPEGDRTGLQSLIGALEKAGNDNITVVRLLTVKTIL